MFWKVFVNFLTSLRLILGIFFAYILFFENNFLLPCLIVYFIAISTDFLDGKLARYYNALSSKGAIFDVLVDFLFIIITCLAMYLKDMLPFFIIFVIFFKLIEFFITSKITKKKYKSGKNQDPNVFLYDPFGHIVALMFYALPLIGILLFSLLPIETFSIIILIICIIITIMAISSSTIRIYGIAKLK